MTFEEVLDQAMAMLQRRGRLTYRTLKLHFQLDDAHLEALKDELIYGQRLAVDEDGRVLVWTGGADVPHALRSVRRHQPPAPQASPRPGPAPLLGTAAPRPNAASSPCCSVTWWTPLALASQLDPEDLREVVRAYQADLCRGHPAL